MSPKGAAKIRRGRLFLDINCILLFLSDDYKKLSAQNPNKSASSKIFLGVVYFSRINERRKWKVAIGKVAQAHTMEELLAKAPTALHALTPGQTIIGTVVNVGAKSIVLDVGGKSEGAVVEREAAAAADFAKTLKAGDKVQCEVLVPETNAGQALLSLRTAALTWAWAGLLEALKEGQEVECLVEGSVRGGLAVSVFGVAGFIPSSHLGEAAANAQQNLVGHTLAVKVIELDRDKNRVVLSEKAVSEAELIAQAEKVLASIKIGDKFTGQVVGLADFGAFVRVEKDSVPLDGLVHLSQISWTKIGNVGDILKEGDTVEVIVIGKDLPVGRQEGGRLSLSIKEAQEDPWKQLAGKYKVDTRVKGKVTKTGDLGAFVELEPGIEGLLRSGKIPADISIKEGDIIECFVEDVDEENRKIGLGLVLKAKPVGYK